MRLRLAIVLLLAWAAPLGAAAQPAGSVPHIGVLLTSTSTENLPDLRQGLRELGYIEGQTIILEVLSAEGWLDRLPGLVAELIRRKVDVIVALGRKASAPRAAPRRAFRS